MGVETLDDVEVDDEVDALRREMINYLVNTSAGYRPCDKRLGGGGVVSKKIFSALRGSVWSKNKAEGAGPPGYSPGSATEYKCVISRLGIRN